MVFTNNYVAPAEPEVLGGSERYGPNPYDLNFVFPVHTQTLETERLKLTPFIPIIHASAYWEAIRNNLHLFQYYPFVWSTFEGVLAYFESVRRNPEQILFSIIDKTKSPDPAHSDIKGGRLAGVIGLFATSAKNLSSEIAHVLVFPDFQRTHVSTNAVGALMNYLLDLPIATPPGLGLRRVSWNAHPGNIPSATLAEKMGLKCEGVLKWYWVLPEALSKQGRPCGREGDPFPGKPGRDTRVLAIGWDDWQDGGREKVQKLIARVR